MSSPAASEVSCDTDIHKLSLAQKILLDVTMAYTYDGTTSYQQAAPLQTFSIPAAGAPQAPPALPLPTPSANATQRVKKKVTAAGPGAIGLNPEIITIQVGEDVATKVMSFSGNGWAVCILSALGIVSNVTLSQGASFHETITYEGYFEILSLSGPYQPYTNRMSSRTGGLSVSLADLGGCVLGGGVAGPLTAASPVQVVIGRFPVEEKQ